MISLIKVDIVTTMAMAKKIQRVWMVKIVDWKMIGCMSKLQVISKKLEIENYDEGSEGEDDREEDSCEGAFCEEICFECEAGVEKEDDEEEVFEEVSFVNCKGLRD